MSDERQLRLLERIAIALESLDKVEALQRQIEALTTELASAKLTLGSVRRGVCCISCGVEITGIGAVAGSARCVDCNRNAR
jgi:hypothetical protein